MNLEDQLRRDEGVRYDAYKDTLGNWTTGVGHLIQSNEQWMIAAHLTDDQVNQILDADIAIAQAGCLRYPWHDKLDPVRQAAVTNIVFNMGIGNFAEFHNTIACLSSGDWKGAHDGLLKSLWASQVGQRAIRLATQILTGEWQ